MNRRFLLRSRPVGRVEPSNFDRVEEPVPTAGPNQAVVRTKYLSLDPTNRVWMGERPSYLPPVAIGEVMRGFGMGEVVESNHPHYKVGDLLVGMTGWQDYSVVEGQGFTPVPTGLPVPQTAFLGALGATGLTAYFGLLELGKPKPGETVLVSAAAGAVGSVVGQLAKIQGCRAVGLAGSAEKCAWLRDELGFDAAVNYKDADWKDQLAAACPSGIDIDFENVGGEIMDHVMTRMNRHGRVVLCGLISAYNEGEATRGRFDLILVKRLRVEGFIILDYAPRFAEGVMALAQWMAAGKLVHRETVVDGLDQAPEALNILFEGGNTGKLIVKVA